MRENAAAARVHLDNDVLTQLDALAARFVGDRRSYAVPTTSRR